MANVTVDFAKNLKLCD